MHIRSAQLTRGKAATARREFGSARARRHSCSAPPPARPECTDSAAAHERGAVPTAAGPRSGDRCCAPSRSARQSAGSCWTELPPMKCQRSRQIAQTVHLAECLLQIIFAEIRDARRGGRPYGFGRLRLGDGDQRDGGGVRPAATAARFIRDRTWFTLDAKFCGPINILGEDTLLYTAGGLTEPDQEP